MCYGSNGRDNPACDHRLVQALESLDPDPKNWSKSPETELDIDYARRYRWSAIWAFKTKIAYDSLQNLTSKFSPALLSYDHAEQP
jgi:hypothetical protein